MIPSFRFGTFSLGIGLTVLLAGCGRGESSHEASEHTEDRTAIHFSTASQEKLGIEIRPVESKILEQTLEVTGQIAQDTDRVVHVNAPEAGRLEELLVSIGQRVEQDASVAVVMSNPGQSPIQVLAPHAGLILGIHVNRGASVDTLTSLMTIADLSQVWATFDIYEQDVALAQLGQKIEAHSVAYPDKV